MQIHNYNQFFTKDYLMGPNSVRLLVELFQKFPLKLEKDAVVLDLGCGKGLTSLVISCETERNVYAADLWISEAENRERFSSWGKDGEIIPRNADANELPFEKEMFDAMVSVDAYHYFAGKKGFFAEKILPFMKKGATVLIAVPGIKDKYETHSEELLKVWAGDDYYMFHGPMWWKNIIGEHDEIECCETWEMTCFDDAWNDWLETQNPFAQGDCIHFDSVIKPYTNFVGIMVKKRG